MCRRSRGEGSAPLPRTNRACSLLTRASISVSQHPVARPTVQTDLSSLSACLLEPSMPSDVTRTPHVSGGAHSSGPMDSREEAPTALLSSATAAARVTGCCEP